MEPTGSPAAWELTVAAATFFVLCLSEARWPVCGVTVPATALAQPIRNPGKQARPSRLIRHPRADLVALDAPRCDCCWPLVCANRDARHRRGSGCHRRAKGWKEAITSDSGDVQRLGPELLLVEIA
jgi:hypothetical protein